VKLAIISLMHTDPWGGSEELWTEMAHAALDEGHEVMAAVFRWPTLHPRLAELQGRGARVLTRRRPRLPSVDKVMSRVLRRPVRLPRPAVLQSATSWGELTRFRPDVVCISQGATFDAVHFPDLLAFLRSSGTPYVALCQANTEVPEDPAYHAAADDLFRRASRVAFVAERNLRVAERQIAAPIPNGSVVRNPINLSSAEAVPWPEPEPVRFACVARFSAVAKGQDVLLQTLAAPEWRGRDWRLRLYGRGSDEGYLRRLIALYGLEDRVELAGHVHDIRALWSDNHLLVLASRMEGTPLALVEAMLCGRPSVVTDVGGNTEWVEEGVSGWVADGSTARSLGAALERAWRARASWPAMGARARETALGQYDPRPGETLLRLAESAAGGGR
jgi:glycosyltransferase involved in cell wall biosynthesis